MSAMSSRESSTISRIISVWLKRAMENPLLMRKIQNIFLIALFLILAELSRSLLLWRWRPTWRTAMIRRQSPVVSHHCGNENFLPFWFTKKALSLSKEVGILPAENYLSVGI